MFQFVRSEDHPLLTELTTSYFALVEADKLLAESIRCRNQSRSELVKQPENTTDREKQEKYVSRQEAYTSAILQERCALSIAHKRMDALAWAIKGVSERLKDNKQPDYWDANTRHDPAKQPFKGFVIDLAKHNVTCAVKLYQQALKTFSRGHVIELDREQTVYIQGIWWFANFQMEHLPHLFSRDERWPETFEPCRLFVTCACELADKPDGGFAVAIENVSPQSVARVMKAFEDAGWETNVAQNQNFDGMPPLQIRGLRTATKQNKA
jgi:hypothetical protein